MTVDNETSPAGYAEQAELAPPEAWDAQSAGYAEYVAPGEQRVAALDLVGLKADGE